MEEIKDKIGILIGTLSSHFSVPVSSIRAETHLYNDLKADSFDLVELAFEFENIFKINLENINFSQILTVQDFLDLLTSHESGPGTSEEKFSDDVKEGS